MAVETFATTNRVVIGGEVGLSDQSKLKDHMGRIKQIARDCIKDIGYEQEKFHWNTVDISNLLHEQSAHIAQGVNSSAQKEEGAGDQGIMFGFACDENGKPAGVSSIVLSTQHLDESMTSADVRAVVEPYINPPYSSRSSGRVAWV